MVWFFILKVILVALFGLACFLVGYKATESDNTIVSDIGFFIMLFTVVFSFIIILVIIY